MQEEVPGGRNSTRKGSEPGAGAAASDAGKDRGSWRPPGRACRADRKGGEEAPAAVRAVTTGLGRAVGRGENGSRGDSGHTHLRQVHEPPRAGMLSLPL